MSIGQSIINVLRFHRKNWKAVALCTFAATVFWLFNALNKNYTTSLDLPLTFQYDEEHYIAIRELPKVVRFNVTGVGWNLVRKSAGLKVPPVVIQLPQPSEVKKIVGSTVPALLTNQPEGFTINFVMTDTLDVAIEPKTKRWVKLQVDIPTLLLKKGYGIVSDIKISPDSVFIEGPLKLINSLAKKVDLKLEDRNIDDDFAEDIEVKFLNDELIKRNPPTVFVSFQVDRYVEIEDSVPLEIVNPPRNSWPVIGGKKWPCTFAVAESFQNSFSRDSVKAIVDLSHITKGENKLLPTIIGLPPYSKVLKLDSVSIKF
jgi:YbbR domain-containing protein